MRGSYADTTRYSESESENPTKQKLKAKNAKVAAMKAELKAMLAQPLIAKGISTRYITSGSRPIVDDLIAGECKCIRPRYESNLNCS